MALNCGLLWPGYIGDKHANCDTIIGKRCCFNSWIQWKISSLLTNTNSAKNKSFLCLITSSLVLVILTKMNRKTTYSFRYTWKENNRFYRTDWREILLKIRCFRKLGTWSQALRNQLLIIHNLSHEKCACVSEFQVLMRMRMWYFAIDLNNDFR
jgi:hypothetical protein